MSVRGLSRRRTGAATRWRQGSATLVLLALALGCEAQSGASLTSEIRPQPLSTALTAFARQTGMQVVYVSALIRGQATHGAPAGLAADEALKRILEGTGLKFERLNARSVRIVEVAPSTPPARYGGDRRAGAATGGQSDEVIVTASAVGERAERVPLSIAVWTREDMDLARIKDLASLAGLTPGVEFDSYPDFGAGFETNISIRGINSRDGSTVAVFRDDVPLPNDRLSAFGRLLPATFDVEQIEVLRGPQGVLLGEGAEGGGVRFISTPPSLTNAGGFARSEYASTARGAVSFEAGGAGGGPLLADTLGVRVGAWWRNDGGYVDRVDPFNGALVDPNANRDSRRVANAALTWAPSATVRLTPALHYEALDVNDTSSFYTYLSDPATGQLKNGKLLQQPYWDAHTLGTLRVAIDGTTTTMSMTTAYLRRHAAAIVDNTNNSFWYWPNPLGPEYPVSYADAKVTPPMRLDQSVLSQQLELGGADPQASWQWRAGAAFVHAAYDEFQPVVASTVSDGGFIDGQTLLQRSTLQSTAHALVELRVAAGWALSVGGRIERDSFTSNALVGGIGYPDRHQFFYVDGAATPYAAHAGLSFSPSDAALYFVNIDRGYRIGGPNPSVGVFCGPTPPSYGPDSIWGVELGGKGRTLGDRLRLSVSVFHMLWRDVQTDVPDPGCGFGYIANAGRAVSDGVDLGVELEATPRFKLALTAAYADAHATETVTSQGGVVVTDGDAIGALPLVAAPLTLVAGVDYHRPVGQEATGRLHAQGIYHSRNPGPFTSQNLAAIVYAPERTADPPTHQLDLSAGLDWRRFSLQAFVSNALDSKPTLQRRNRIPGDTLFYATTFRPRTIGMSANWRFGQVLAD